MDFRICDYCGTEFGMDETECPLCGTVPAEKPQKDTQPEPVKAQQPVKKPAAKGGARLAKNKKKSVQEDRVPKWMWAVTCCVLGLAVVIGLVYFCYSMGFFDGKDPENTMQGDFREELPDESYEEEYAPETGTQDQVPDVQPDGVPCTSLTLNLSHVELDQEGSSIFLTAVAKPNDCTYSIQFMSSDDSIVTVNENGLVTAVGPGQAELIVSCGDITQICTVNCAFETEEPPVEDDPPVDTDPDKGDKPEVKPTLSSVDFTLKTPGETTTLKVIDAPNGAEITFSSSDSKVVTVTSTGLVTAVGNGTATITVMVDDIKLTCIARCDLGDSAENGNGTVHPGPYRLVNEYGTEGDATLVFAGETCTLMLLDANGEKIEGLTWTSNNTSVATVSATGKVTAVGKGQTKITTVYNGQTFTFIIRCNF